MITVTPILSNIFVVGPTRNEYLIVFGHNGLNIFSHGKHKFEEKNKIQLKELEINEVSIAKTKYIRWFPEVWINQDYFQHLVYRILEWSHKNGVNSIGILVPRLEHGRNTDINRRRSVITLNETIITISKFLGTFPETIIKTVDLYSLSTILVDTLGSEPIQVFPLQQKSKEELITAVAVSILSEDEVNRDKIMKKFFINPTKTAEILENLEENGIISRFNPRMEKQRILVDNIFELKQKLEKLWSIT